MVRIRRFGIVRTATTIAVLYIVIVALFAVPFALFAAAAGGVPNAASGGRFGAVEILILAAIVAAVYGVFGWIATAIACGIYNLAARFTGGIVVETEPVTPPPPAPAWGPVPGTTGPASPPTVG